METSWLMPKTERERKLADLRRIFNNAYPLDYRAPATHARELKAVKLQTHASVRRRDAGQSARAR